MVKVCGPEVQACVPTWSVAFSMTSAGDLAQKPDMPRLSPEEPAWCGARRHRFVRPHNRGAMTGGDDQRL